MNHTTLHAFQDALYQERLERARKMTVSERLALGPQLFGEVAERMKIGIRMQEPSASSEQVDQLLIQKMNSMKAWKERDLYKPVQPS